MAVTTLPLVDYQEARAIQSGPLTIFHAWHPATGQRRLVRVLDPGSALGREAVENALTSLIAAHATETVPVGVLQIDDAGRTDTQTPYAASPLNEYDLQRLEQHRGPLGWAEASPLIDRLAEAIVFAHDRGWPLGGFGATAVQLAPDGKPQVDLVPGVLAAVMRDQAGGEAAEIDLEGAMIDDVASLGTLLRDLMGGPFHAPSFALELAGRATDKSDTASAFPAADFLAKLRSLAHEPTAAIPLIGGAEPVTPANEVAVPAVPAVEPVMADAGLDLSGPRPEVMAAESPELHPAVASLDSSEGLAGGRSSWMAEALVAIAVFAVTAVALGAYLLRDQSDDAAANTTDTTASVSDDAGTVPVANDDTVSTIATTVPTSDSSDSSDGEPTPEVPATTIPADVPAAVTAPAPDVVNLGVTQISGQTARIEWSSSVCVGSEYVFEGGEFATTQGGFPAGSDQCWYNHRATLGTEPFTSSPLQADSQYVVSVRSQDETGQWSAARSEVFTTLDAPPGTDPVGAGPFLTELKREQVSGSSVLTVVTSSCSTVAMRVGAQELITDSCADEHRLDVAAFAGLDPGATYVVSLEVISDVAAVQRDIYFTLPGD